MHGFFGKIPGHGDFITRNLPRTFLDKWDDWLQNCIAESKAQLGERWLDIYLTSPVWRFAIKAGICGGAWAGVMMPSVDRVGRYFPLTIATPLPPEAVPFALPRAGEAWFDRVEGLALKTLDDDHFEANGLQSALDAVDAIGQTSAPSAAFETTADAWSLAVHLGSDAEASAAIADALVERRTGPYSLWWTAAVPDATAPVVVVGGLPDPRSYAEFLQGAWGDVRPGPAGDSPDIGAVVSDAELR